MQSKYYNINKIKQIIFVLFILPAFLSAQKLAEDKYDKFTKTSVKRTEWFPFTKKKGTMRPTESSYRISKLGETLYLDLKMMLNNQAYSVPEGAELMFLMTDDSVLKVNNLHTTITTMGAGAIGYGGSANLGTETSYVIDQNVYDKLLKGTVSMVRIYTSLGYTEYEVKPGLDKGIKNLLLSVQ